MRWRRGRRGEARTGRMKQDAKWTGKRGHQGAWSHLLLQAIREGQGRHPARLAGVCSRWELRSSQPVLTEPATASLPRTGGGWGAGRPLEMLLLLWGCSVHSSLPDLFPKYARSAGPAPRQLSFLLRRSRKARVAGEASPCRGDTRPENSCSKSSLSSLKPYCASGWVTALMPTQPCSSQQLTLPARAAPCQDSSAWPAPLTLAWSSSSSWICLFSWGGMWSLPYWFLAVWPLSLNQGFTSSFVKGG